MPLPDGPGAMPIGGASGGAAGYAQPGAEAYGQPPGAMPPPASPQSSPHGTRKGGRHAAPQGGADDSEATQMIPPFPAGGPAGGPDSEATQFLPPVAGGTGGPDSDSEATQMLPPMAADGGVAAGMPGGAPPVAGGAPAGGPETRRPLPEFDNLFRSDSPSPTGPRLNTSGNDEPGSTQSLPIFDQAAEQQHSQPPRQGAQRPGYGYPQPGAQPGPQPGAQPSGYGYPQPGAQQHEPQREPRHGQPQPGGRAARRGAERGRGRRRAPSGLLIGGGFVGVAVIGLVVGLLIANSGGEGDDTSGGDKPKASSSPASEKSSAAPDPVEAQAKKLDALLADSNNSRSSVVRSVQNIKQCKALGKAASDLRAAAKQRTALVRRLAELKTDKIPSGTQLNASLKSAWQSSASADNHYAGWAGQVAHKKGCHKGKAKSSRRLAAANTASGKATIAKKKAARLWNPTAKKYGLKERQFGEL
jgi:hypothetical protein